MRGNPGLRLRLFMGGLAATGVVAAHSLAYVVASPDPHGRTELLESTGHGGYSTLVAVALGLLAAGLVRLAAGSTWGPRSEVTGSRLFTLAVPRLLVLQLGGFALLEAAERALVGLGPIHVLGEPAVAIGLLLQAVIALVGAGLLVLFARTFQRLFSQPSFTPGTRDGLLPGPMSRMVPPRFEVAAGGGTLRGPPFGF